MANTKITPRKLPICPICKTGVAFEVRFEKYLKECEKAKKERDKVTCETCGVVFKKRAYYYKHVKNQHGSQKKSPGNETDDGWGSYKDPDISIGETSEEDEGDDRECGTGEGNESVESRAQGEIQLGRIVRKAITPLMPGPRKRPFPSAVSKNAKEEPAQSDQPKPEKRACVEFVRSSDGKFKIQKLRVHVCGKVRYETTSTCPNVVPVAPVKLCLRDMVGQGHVDVQDIYVEVDAEGELTVSRNIKD